MSTFRKFYAGLFALTLGLVSASEVSRAQCPPAPSGPNQTITQYGQCCTDTLSNAYCGIQNGMCVLGEINPPVFTATSIGPNAVHLSVAQGNYWSGALTACTLGYCGPPATYGIWVPYVYQNKKNINHRITYNIPSTAWIGNQFNRDVDLTKLNSGQCTVEVAWNIDPLSKCSVTDHKEIYPLGLCQLAPQTKPQPNPTTKTCGVNINSTGKPCIGGQFDPVDPYSGDYYYSDEDLVVPGIIPLKVVRAYTSSQSTFTGPFGIGTYLAGYNYTITVPLNMGGTLNTSPNQTVTFDEGNGLTTSFTNGAGGGLVFTNEGAIGTAGSTLTLSEDGSNFFTGGVYETPQKSKFTFDANGWLTQSEDYIGNAITFTRNGSGKLLTATSYGKSLTFSYNGAGLISQVQDHTGRTTQYRYDGSNRLTFVTNPLNYSKGYGWDSSNRVQTMRDYRGKNRIYNIYDSTGMLHQQIMPDASTTTGYQLDATGALVRRITDPNGNTTTYTYNSEGLPTQITDGLSHSTNITYSASLFNGSPTGRYIEVTDPLSHTYREDLDANNLPTTITDPDSETTVITYDTTWLGKPKTITDPEGHTTTFDYDVDGNLEKITDADGKETNMTYNARGQVLTVTNALNKTTTYEYDEAGSIVGDLIQITDPLNRETDLGYDTLSRLTSYTDPNNNVTQFTYDAGNQLKQITDPYSKAVVYTYDGNGNVTQLKNKRNNTTNYEYDDRDNLITQTQPGSIVTRWYYDQADRLTKITDPKSQSLLFTYDNANRLTQQKLQVGATFPITYDYTYDNADNLLTINDGTNTWTYSYDNLDRVTGLVSPQGTVGYTYNADSLRTQLTATGQTAITYDYDVLDRLTDITQGGDTYTYDYDDIGRRTSLTRPNGVVTSYTYDDANQLTQMRHLKSGVIDDPYDYTYDDNGNILTVLRESKTRTYTYDALNRVTKMVKSPVPGENMPKQIDWTYDFNNDITQRKETSDSNVVTTYDYTYNNLDRLTQRTTNGGSAVTFSYDNNGNMTGDSTGKTYTWNGLDQMTASSGGNTYSYDPLGRRTAFNSKTYFYDALDMITDGTVSLINGDGIDEPLRMTNGGTESDYLSDLVGSITQLTDNTGTSTGVYYYDPYGTQLTGSSPVSINPFTYTGREDDGTGLYFYRNRYYDPTLEVFTSQDPLGSAQRYVEGNPIKRIDPLGLDLLTADNKNPITPPGVAGSRMSGFGTIGGPQGIGSVYQAPGFRGGIGQSLGSCGSGCGPARSLYLNTTFSGSRPNVDINLTPAQFGQNLVDSGWKRTVTDYGADYTKEGCRYAVRGYSKSRGATVEYFPKTLRPRNKAPLKLRLIND